VTQGVHDLFVAALAAKVAALCVGDALSPDSQMGPLASEAQLETTLEYLGIATKEGGRRVTGGERRRSTSPASTCRPCHRDTKPDMRVNCEEVFGPLASTVRVRDYDEALAVANSGEFSAFPPASAPHRSKYARHFTRNVRAAWS